MGQVHKILRIEDIVDCAQNQVIFPSGSREKPFMIEQISLTNFRCFKKLDVDNLKRINLIVGENSSGKSAFLESIFLSSGSLAPNATFQVRSIRRMGNQLVVPGDAQAYWGLWEDLFYDFVHDEKVSLKMVGNPNSDTRTLSVEFVKQVGSQEIPFGKTSLRSDVAQLVSGLPQIQFTWKRTGFPAIVSTPKITNSGLQYDSSRVDFFPCIWFTPGAQETVEDNAKRFSELDKRGERELIASVLRREFPYIIDLSIDYHAGLPMVFADIKGKSKKMPIPLVSDGVNKLLAICLGLANYKGGTVLIDQLEDGFHHKILPSIWKSLYILAKEFGVQLFVSTHSEECIRAMQSVLIGNESDFCLLRASRREKWCVIDSLPGSYLENALEQDFEVR